MTGEGAAFKSMFPGWLDQRQTPGDFFRTALLVPDANVLLGCYRIGPQAREQLFKTLERQRDRLWVPHQSALGFSRNRTSVLSDQKARHSTAKKLVSGALDRAVTAVEDAVKALRDYRTVYIPHTDWRPDEHRLTKDQIKTALSALLQPVTTELATIGAEHDVTVKEFADEPGDRILNRLTAMLDGRVGPRYDRARIQQIVQETVEFRFPNSVPPGYLDAKDKSPLGAAGDVILWYQIIDRLRSAEGGFRKVVWITTDVKPDLWERDRAGNHVSARAELVQELYEETSALLHMVDLHGFLAGAKEFLQEDISDETLEQAQGLNAIPGIAITVLVTDLARSVAFYRDKLGFYEIDTNPGTAVLASGDTRLVLRLSREVDRLIYLNLEVGDIEAAFRELTAKGVPFVHEPQPVNRGDRLELWSATLHDPDGHNIAITQWRAVG